MDKACKVLHWLQSICSEYHTDRKDICSSICFENVRHWHRILIIVHDFHLAHTLDGNNSSTCLIPRCSWIHDLKCIAKGHLDSFSCTSRERSSKQKLRNWNSTFLSWPVVFTNNCIGFAWTCCLMLIHLSVYDSRNRCCFTSWIFLFFSFPLKCSYKKRLAYLKSIHQRFFHMFMASTTNKLVIIALKWRK